jgi:hypothetical protein
MALCRLNCQSAHRDLRAHKKRANGYREKGAALGNAHPTPEFVPQAVDGRETKASE